MSDACRNPPLRLSFPGFFNSVALSPQSTVQDTLRLISLWFSHGAHPELAATVSAGLSTVSIDTWLQVCVFGKARRLGMENNSISRREAGGLVVIYIFWCAVYAC